MTSRARKWGSWIALAVVVPLAVVLWVLLLRNHDEAPGPPKTVARVDPSAIVVPATPADRTVATPGTAVEPASPRPRPTTRRGPTPEQLADAHAADEAQQKELAAALGEASPVSALPQWVKRADITADGRLVIFGDPVGKLFGLDALKDSAERFAAGQTSIIRGGRLVLTDTRGRLWLNQGTEGPLYCFDHGTLTPIPLKPSNPSEDNSPARQRIRANFAGRTRVVAAAEGRDGVCRFLVHAVRDSYLLVAVLPDGSSTCLRIGDADNDIDLNSYQAGGARFVEQDQGLITIVPRAVPIAKVFQFDGSQWVTLSLPKPDKRDVYGVTAVIDGSLLLFNTDRRLSTFWSPAAAKAAAARVDTYIADLSDAAFPKRRAAYVHLSLCGEMARERLQAAANDAANLPETTQACQKLLADIGKPHERRFNDETTQTLYGGRYWYDQVTLLSDQWQGRPLLMLTYFVDGMKDQPIAAEVDPDQAQSSEMVALAVLSADGDLEVKQVFSRDELAAAGMRELPLRAFVDQQHQLWDNGRKLWNADFSLAKAPRGQFFTYMDGQDRDGRILTRNNDLCYVLRPGTAVGAPLLPETEFTGLDWVRLTPDSHAAIAHAGAFVGHAEHGAIDLYRLDGGKTKWLTCPEGSTLQMVTPLKDDKVFAYLAALTQPISAAYYDGKQWKTDMNSSSLLATITRDVAAAAPTHYGREGEFATDGEGHLWSYIINSEPQPDAPNYGVQYYPCERLHYFDGQDIHDVWADWNRLEGKPVDKPANDPMHSAPGEGYPNGRRPIKSTRLGKAMLVQNKRFETWQLHYEGAKLVVDPIPLEGEVLQESGPVKPGVRTMSELQGLELYSRESAAGDTWFSLSASKQICVLKDGHVTKTDHHGMVLMIDSKDRVWCVELKRNDDHTTRLFVLVDGRGVDVTLDRATRVSSVVEGPDKRLWLVDSGALYQLEATGDGAGFAVRTVHRWPWPALRTGFSPKFVDHSDGLWCSSGDATYTRISLPKR